MTSHLCMRVQIDMRKLQKAIWIRLNRLGIAVWLTRL